MCRLRHEDIAALFRNRFQIPLVFTALKGILTQPAFAPMSQSLAIAHQPWFVVKDGPLMALAFWVSFFFFFLAKPKAKTKTLLLVVLLLSD